MSQISWSLPDNSRSKEANFLTNTQTWICRTPTYVNICIHTLRKHTHTHVQTYRHNYIHMCGYIYIYMHADAHTCTQTKQSNEKKCSSGNEHCQWLLNENFRRENKWKSNRWVYISKQKEWLFPDAIKLNNSSGKPKIGNLLMVYFSRFTTFDLQLSLSWLHVEEEICYLQRKIISIYSY